MGRENWSSRNPETGEQQNLKEGREIGSANPEYPHVDGMTPQQHEEFHQAQQGSNSSNNAGSDDDSE